MTEVLILHICTELIGLHKNNVIQSSTIAGDIIICVIFTGLDYFEIINNVKQFYKCFWSICANASYERVYKKKPALYTFPKTLSKI
jgi:hypothetical protein